MFHKHMAIDFETYSATSLPVHGLKRYVTDPTFTPTLASVVTEDRTQTFDFVRNGFAQVQLLEELRDYYDQGYMFWAHNAGFERAVLKHLGAPDYTIYDTAVLAAMNGADRHLAGAARQLLNQGKLDEDGSLMRLFAMPQTVTQNYFDKRVVSDNLEKWQLYMKYCERDAYLAYALASTYFLESESEYTEMEYSQITLKMNETGWPVNRTEVLVMREKYQDLLASIEKEFRQNTGSWDLNFSSHPQLVQWCAERGVKATSFDKLHVEKMIARLEKRRDAGLLKDEQADVLNMLQTKQLLGGSSLKKLDTILNTELGGRVYDQYVHVGAAQSWRTSGRSVQMQNLPRLGPTARDLVDVLNDENAGVEYLSSNIRQVFQAGERDGVLMVSDFASMESRALAWLAGERWKLDAYRAGTDVYVAQAEKIFNKPAGSGATKEERTTGKVGELSCGYGAGPVAVRDFAAKMHVEMSEDEAKQLVWDWRDANPATTDLWKRLNDALHKTVDTGQRSAIDVGDHHYVTFGPSYIPTPTSLLDQALRKRNRRVQSIEMTLVNAVNDHVYLQRIFHGCYSDGDNVRYYKPSSLKTGDPWKDTYVDPKTKRSRHYELYGGKLAGILTQSLCREIFFKSLWQIDQNLPAYAQMVGQFHDEVIVEILPSKLIDLPVDKAAERVEWLLHRAMSKSPDFPTLPMDAEVKHARRYIK